MRNIEALRNYFLGKDPQLEVVLSDNSLRLSGIEGKHYILRGELIKRLTDLKTAMEEADEALQGSIDDLNLWKDTTPFVLDSDLAAALSNYYTKTQVDNLLSVIPRFSIEVVEQLPTQDISTTTIYLAPSEDPQAANSYDEFIYVNNSWEQIGSTAIDMSDYYTKEEVNAKTFINTLTQDVTIPENSELNPLLLSTGWWYTGEHVIYYGESVEPTIHNNALFYFNAEAGDQWFYFLPPNLEDGWNQLGTYLWFDSTDHIWQYSGYGVVTTINDQSTDMSIPTAATVHDFVINNGAGIKTLTSPVRIWGLEDGIYRLPHNCLVYWYGDTSTATAYTIQVRSSGYLLVSSDATTKEWYITDDTNLSIGATTQSGGNSFSYNFSKFENKDNKVTSISSSSTNTQYPSALAVYNAIQTALANNKFKLLKPTGDLATETQNIYDLSEGTYMICQLTDATLLLAYSGGRRPLTFTPDNLSLLMVDSSHNYKYLSADGSTYYYGLADASSGTKTEFILDDFTGTDGVNAGTSGLVPAPETTDTDKYLKSDGTWSTVQAGTTITYGTADLTPGVSPLNEGEFYFVYE